MLYILLEISKMICGRISKLYQLRHCYQEDIDDVVFQNSDTGGLSELSFYKIKKLGAPQATKDKVNFLIGSRNYEVCDAKFDDYRASKNLGPEKYSYFPGSFPDKRYDFCICIFMKELYVLGGYCDDFLRSCLKYNFTHNKWSYIANMNEKRRCAACTVFEGRIVVSGGDNFALLKSVEAYDHYENNWTHLPDMTGGRSKHFLISLSNKLFVIGGFTSNTTTEVFDSVNRKFSYIRNDNLSSCFLN